jgi:hypothetical protein
MTYVFILALLLMILSDVGLSQTLPITSNGVPVGAQLSSYPTNLFFITAPTNALVWTTTNLTSAAWSQTTTGVYAANSSYRFWKSEYDSLDSNAAVWYATTNYAVLMWNPSANTNITGYRVWFGLSPTNYYSFTIPLANHYTVSNLVVGQTYYFALTSIQGTLTTLTQY